GEWQIGLAQSRAGNCQCVDRVALAERAGAVAGVRHQLRWHAQDPLSRSEQIAFQPTREVTAVLHRPDMLTVPGRPGDELEMVARPRPRRPLRELATPLVDDHDRVSALVRVDP